MSKSASPRLIEGSSTLSAWTVVAASFVLAAALPIVMTFGEPSRDEIKRECSVVADLSRNLRVSTVNRQVGRTPPERGMDCSAAFHSAGILSSSDGLASVSFDRPRFKGADEVEVFYSLPNGGLGGFGAKVKALRRNDHWRIVSHYQTWFS